jgi:hypothetical protein
MYIFIYFKVPFPIQVLPYVSVKSNHILSDYNFILNILYLFRCGIPSSNILAIIDKKIFLKLTNIKDKYKIMYCVLKNVSVIIFCVE